MSDFNSESHLDTPMSDETLKQSQKKKKRTLGSFPCPDCDKVFSRSDHLSRHHLNHQPKEVFECDFILEEDNGIRKKCGKRFVRKDLKERHARRHLELMKLEVNLKKRKPSSDQIDKSKQDGSRKKSIGKPACSSDLSQIPLPISSNSSPLQISNLIHTRPNDALETPGQFPLPINNSFGTSPTVNNSLVTQKPPHPQAQPQSGYSTIPIPNNIVEPSIPNDFSVHQSHLDRPHLPGFDTNHPQSQVDVLSWLFNDNAQNYSNQVDRTPNVDQNILQPLTNASINVKNPNEFPSPFDSSQISPNPNDRVSILPSQPNSNWNSIQDPNSNPLTPFYHPASQYNSYFQNLNNLDIQDMNFIPNSTNPLEEIFLRKNNEKYNSKALNGLANNNNFQFSSMESSSPTNTNDSLTSRSGSDINLTPETYEINFNQNNLMKVIQEHGLHSNVSKKKCIFIDSLLVNSLIKSIPSLNRKQIEDCFVLIDDNCSLENRFSFYLSKYWKYFHPQFSILHKPSFDTKLSQPLLLLAMIIIGANYCAPIPTILNGKLKKDSYLKFCDLIAEPLRFMIFQHKDFKTPTKLWVLQTLNLLEWSEKNFLLREMHERAHIHHGTTVQLLRRSPLLGGNPTHHNKQVTQSNTSTSTGGEESSDINTDLNTVKVNDQHDVNLFNEWVESESMKRITFMTFYLDIIDYIKFRHNPQMTFYQLQLLNLPCNDNQLWESQELNGSFRKIVKRQKKLQSQIDTLHRDNHHFHKNESGKMSMGIKFINALKDILKPAEEIKGLTSTHSIFSRKILFAGLISIMYQMQQTDLQNNSSLLTTNGIVSNRKNQVWKEILSKAFDNWTIQSNCYGGVKLPEPLVFQHKPFQCKFPMYHLTQIIGMADINHYDIAIFGGSPANQSVGVTKKDRLIVRRKLNSMWSRNLQMNKLSINDIINLKSVVHCYLLLWELMLKPNNDLNPDDKTHSIFIDWSVENDYFDSMYAIGIATMVLWCYVYSTYGIESHRFNEIENLGKHIRDYSKMSEYSAEGGYQYLLRIRQEFYTNLRKNNLHKEFNIHPFNLESKKHTPHEILVKHCELLPQLSNKQHISGLCFLVGSKLLSSQWLILRESARLILNCALISIGKPDIVCEDLFDSNLSE
ncbi:hypothetical protein HYPBUDRAFT_238835 [Hyphopichia burtonii NRRL Y-1933]|uniref:C2H2-type domain-containing protein n=1 Tax=Hyphopichia burtonii NRRL Y-1933 TaxID=984485 RepID=A0A1E4RNY2_9ASCO|nr:hypothetical protein HYPBUDRAFT_238835 [Hyphopichia burtonii NRRL Y-1933]ODV68982.1 hypothetical protein HYPBUDRAFT_238835 [Hyphopichia burtonii NRRL Y-1933]